MTDTRTARQRYDEAVAMAEDALTSWDTDLRSYVPAEALTAAGVHAQLATAAAISRLADAVEAGR